jgi:hypothetical protein
MEEGRRIPGWALPVAGVLSVVALVVIGMNREPASLDPDTPEGTVQLYIEALVDGDFDTAASYWDEEGCIPGSAVPTGGAPDVAAALVSVDGNDIQANVVVKITETSQDPLGGLYEHEEWFTLVRQDDVWKIRQPSWPYYDQICEEAA